MYGTSGEESIIDGLDSTPSPTTAAIATHRLQFLPLIAATLGGLLAARFAEQGEGEPQHQCVVIWDKVFRFSPKA